MELISLIYCLVMSSAILEILSLTVFAETGMPGIFCTISLLFLKSVNKCSDIVMNEFFLYSPSVNGLPCLTIS